MIKGKINLLITGIFKIYQARLDFIFCEIDYDKKLDIDTSVIIIIKFKNGVIAKLMSGFNNNYLSDYKIFSYKSLRYYLLFS